MSVESAVRETSAPRARGGGPSLTPVEVAAGDEIEPVLRAARAEVAALGLEVRARQRRVESLELEAGAMESATADGEARARRDEELAGYRRELDDAFAARRRELDAELARERVEADAAIEAARVEAAAIVVPATGQLQRLLERISGGPASSEDLTTPVQGEHQPPTSDGAGGSAAPVDVDAATAAEPDPVAVARTDVAPIDVAPAAAPVSADVAPPAAPYLAFVLPSQEPNAAPALYPAPAYMGQPMMPGQPMMMPGQPMMMPGQPMMVPGMMPPVTAPVPPVVVPAEPIEREPFLRRLWHLDVMAPIIAVLIVLFVLAAWVL